MIPLKASCIRAMRQGFVQSSPSLTCRNHHWENILYHNLKKSFIVQQFKTSSIS